MTPGIEAVIDYNVQPYTNLCCPVDCNPACVNGSTCADCNYNYNGHTPPVYALNSHLVFYRRNPASNVVATPFEGDRLEVRPNAPNPFRPPTTITYLLPVAGAVDIRVLDAGGRLVRRATVEQEGPGEYQWTWDGRDGHGSALPAGVLLLRGAVRRADRCAEDAAGEVARRELRLERPAASGHSWL